jgi:hypothetical protein
MSPSPAAIHSPFTGHFRCDCGARLLFGIHSDTLGLMVLVNQAREGNHKTGTCPRCGRRHIVPVVGPLAPRRRGRGSRSRRPVKGA